MMNFFDSDNVTDDQSHKSSSHGVSPELPPVLWSTNGNPFRIMDLPAELRTLIYKFALGAEIYPIATPLKPTATTQASNVHLFLGRGHDSAWYSEQFPTEYVAEAGAPVPAPNLNLLLTNKQVHSEVLEYAWRKLYKCFVVLEIFLATTRASQGSAMRYAYIPRTPLTTERLGYLSHIELNFSNKEYFRMFGLETDPIFVLNSAQSYGQHLQAIKGLKFLDLRFRSPQDGWSGCPFNSRDQPFICCQRTMVDWICTFAWPFVANRGIVVKVTGAVKLETKQKWDSIFAGHIPHDQSAAMEAIFSTPPHHLPPRCTCRQACLIEVAKRKSDQPWPYDLDEDMFDTEDDSYPKHGKYIWKGSSWFNVGWEDHDEDGTGFDLNWPDDDEDWEDCDEDSEDDNNFGVVWDFGDDASDSSD